MSQRIDFCTVTLKHDEHLTKYHEEWAKIFREESDHSGAHGIAFLAAVLTPSLQTRVPNSDACCCLCELCRAMVSPRC